MMNGISNISRYTVALIIVWTAISVTSAYAQDRIHEVKQGETMVSIAQAYQMTANELRALNKLPNERVEVGQKLLVRNVEPVWPMSTTQASTGVGIDPKRIGSQSRSDSTEQMTLGMETQRMADSVSTAIPSTIVPPAIKPPSEPALIEREHLVQPSETLFSIANQYGMLVADLARRNRIVGNDVTAGLRLTVLVPDTGTQEQEQPQDVALAFDAMKHEWYIVKTSDTLPSIARYYGMSIAQLRELNGSKINTMNVGDRIIVLRNVAVEEPTKNDSIYVEEVVEAFDPFGAIVNRGRFIGYIVKRNEGLASIIESFLMDESDFYALNPSLERRPPRTGAEVLVYEPPSNLQPNPYAVDATANAVGSTELATVYADFEKGKLTASGELYNPENLTVASTLYPLGSILYILNPESGKGTYVRVNDQTEHQGIILSRSAAAVLGINPLSSNRVLVSKEL